MIVQKIEIEITTLRLSMDELRILKNALNEVCNVIPKNHIDLRLEISIDRAIALSNHINDKLIAGNNLTNQSEFKVTLNELRALKNSLNEVCHGIKLVDFEKKIGFSRDRVKILFDEVWEGLREVLKYLSNSPKE
ncbi:MAG: hypothetical protein WBA74_18480 [Cyclobacteriaceae bacterium]